MALEGKAEGNLSSAVSEMFKFLASCELTQFPISKSNAPNARDFVVGVLGTKTSTSLRRQLTKGGQTRRISLSVEVQAIITGWRQAGEPPCAKMRRDPRLSERSWGPNSPALIPPGERITLMIVALLIFVPISRKILAGFVHGILSLLDVAFLVTRHLGGGCVGDSEGARITFAASAPRIWGRGSFRVKKASRPPRTVIQNG
jgi:hypothetical protein